MDAYILYAKAMSWRERLLGSGVPKAKPRVATDWRVYAVGDVHGRADLLSKLFMCIDEDLKARPPAESVQVFLGDYIDRVRTRGRSSTC
jgi:hypothetical protein